MIREAGGALVEQHDVVRSMVAAAETWGQQQFNTPMMVVNVGEPECCADGTTRTTVELHAVGQEPTRVQCLVTLEPDGSLSCFVRDTSTP